MYIYQVWVKWARKTGAAENPGKKTASQNADHSTAVRIRMGSH